MNKNQILEAKSAPNIASSSFDPISMEVLRHKLEGITNEMQMKLIRGSFSPIVKEGFDASASMFTSRGESLAQAIAVPTHLAMMIPIVEKILEVFPAETIQEGDVFIHNDPYAGGTHLPDIAIIVPVFVEEALIALTATLTHHQDVGGMCPGSVPTNSTEIYQEGLRIPPMRLFDAGRRNETLFDIMEKNIRIPQVFFGDLNAQVASCTIGKRRLIEAAGPYQGQDIRAMFDALLDKSELMTRVAISKLPDGVYSASDCLDNDGVETDKPVNVKVTVTIEGDSIHCDLTGSSAQVKGPFNCVPSGTLSAACFVVRALTDPTIPSNGGCFRSIKLTLPEGSIVNPTEPAPVSSRTNTIKRITGCLLAALREAMPDRVPADSAGQLTLLSFGGERDDGTRYIVGELIGSGSGASLHSDGVDAVDTDVTNCMNMPIEQLEQFYPFHVHHVGTRPESGGKGTFRGGLGAIREYELLEGSAVLTYRGERHNSQASGAFGGFSGASARCCIIAKDGSKRDLPSKIVTVIEKGDRLIVETAGGGGHGPVSARCNKAVARDIANRKVRA